MNNKDLKERHDKWSVWHKRPGITAERHVQACRCTRLPTLFILPQECGGTRLPIHRQRTIEPICCSELNTRYSSTGTLYGGGGGGGEGGEGGGGGGEEEEEEEEGEEALQKVSKAAHGSIKYTEAIRTWAQISNLFDFVRRHSKVKYAPTFLTYLLTHSMEQSPSWEANWFCS